MPAPDAIALRADARRCISAALAAVEPERLVLAALDAEPLPERTALLAIGKAAEPMAAAALRALGRRVASALVVAPRDERPAAYSASVETLVPTIRLRSDHPLPTAASARAAHAVLDWIDARPPGAHLLVLLSGGASALVALPAPGLDIDDLATTTDALLRAGADIEALNAVRKHLDLSKGGRLARRAAGRDVLVLAISDVVGDRLDTIGSGPFHPDATTYGDALAAVAGLDALPDRVRRRLEMGASGEWDETPKAGDPCFARVQHRIIGNNVTACGAALRKARALGYDATRIDAPIVGEARIAGRRLAEAAQATHGAKACLVGGGETTVTVRGAGRGGRNQELALAAAVAIDGTRGCVVASFGTDGIDGPTDAAGAIIDGATCARIRAAKLEPAAALEDNDSHTALEAAGDLLRTGPTGTNVGDVQIVLWTGADAVTSVSG
jgi:glycerate 2-kinase